MSKNSSNMVDSRFKAFLQGISLSFLLSFGVLLNAAEDEIKGAAAAGQELSLEDYEENQDGEEVNSSFTRQIGPTWEEFEGASEDPVGPIFDGDYGDDSRSAAAPAMRQPLSHAATASAAASEPEEKVRASRAPSLKQLAARLFERAYPRSVHCLVDSLNQSKEAETKIEHGRLDSLVALNQAVQIPGLDQLIPSMVSAQVSEKLLEVTDYKLAHVKSGQKNPHPAIHCAKKYIVQVNEQTGEIRVYDTVEKKEVACYVHPGISRWGAKINAGQTHVLSHAGNSAKLFTIATGNHISIENADWSGFGQNYAFISTWHSDARNTQGYSEKLSIYDLNTDGLVAQLPLEGVTETEVSPQGTSVAVGTRAGQLTLFNLVDKTSDVLILLGLPIVKVTFDERERYVMVATKRPTGSANQDHYIQIIDLKNRRSLGQWHSGYNRISRIAFDSNNRFAMIGIADGLIAFNLESQKHQEMRTNRYVHHLFSPDGIYFARVAEYSNEIMLNIPGQDLRLGHHAEGVSHCIFNKQSTHLVTCSKDGNVRIFDITAMKYLEHPGHKAEILRCFFNNKSQLVTAAKDGSVSIFDTQTMKIIAHPGHSRPIVHCFFDPREKYLVTTAGQYGIRADEVKIFDMTHEREIAHEGHNDRIIEHIEFDPAGQQLITIDQDNVVKLWALEQLSLERISFLMALYNAIHANSVVEALQVCKELAASPILSKFSPEIRDVLRYKINHVQKIRIEKMDAVVRQHVLKVITPNQLI